MSTHAQQDQWLSDNAVLAQIGAALYEIDTRLAVVLPKAVAEQAVAAWNRDDSEAEPEPDSEETHRQRTVRQRAGTLALVGAAIESRGRHHTVDTVGVQLDAWFVGLALEAADDHGLIIGPPPTRSRTSPRFITVDLDIRSAPEKTIDTLVAALDATGTIQTDHRDDSGQFVSFALGEHHETITSCIMAIAAVIDQLGLAARAEWDNASSRVFNVGIEAGRESEQPVITLDAALISLATSLSAGLTLTHYPCHDRHTGFNHTAIS